MITNPLTVKQIKLQELSLRDIHSIVFAIIFLYEWLYQYVHTYVLAYFLYDKNNFLIQNVKILSVFTNLL